MVAQAAGSGGRFLASSSPDAYRNNLPAFRRGLSETGYVEGQNVAIEL